MPGKNFSAVQRLAHTLYAPPRYFSGRTLVAKSFDALSLHSRLSHKRAWPQREETFAAVQLMRQNRNWSNLRKFGSVIIPSMTMARRGITPRRNNILTAKNASAMRSGLKSRDISKKHNSQYQKKSAVHRLQQTESFASESSEKGSHSKDGREDTTDDDNMDVRSVRDVVFGIPENNDDQKKQRMEDDELLKRISSQRPYNIGANLSKKVIAPYQTYRSHRNCWAEFRHRLVYGGSNYY